MTLVETKRLEVNAELTRWCVSFAEFSSIISLTPLAPPIHCMGQNIKSLSACVCVCACTGKVSFIGKSVRTAHMMALWEMSDL